MDGILQRQNNYTTYDHEKGPPLANKLISQRYSNDHVPKKTKMFNTAKRKIGRNSLPNCLSFFNKINFD